MTLEPETLLLALNGVILSLAYFLIYPRMVGADISKLMQSDLLATVTSVIVAGFVFWGTNQPFDLLFGEVNWFAFSVVTFLLMEVPFALWYLKKFDVQV
jgi:hypothetical protein